MPTPDELLAEVQGNLWRPRKHPQEHGLEAAYNFLALELSHRAARWARDPAMWGENWEARANDVLRAAHLPALPITDPGVHKNVLKLMGGYKLEPVLLVNWSDRPGLLIADGYHRVSAVYLLSPDLMVSCFSRTTAANHGTAA